MSWVTNAGRGFVRACVLLGVSLTVPAVWAAAVAVCIWWHGNPWSWIAPIVWAGIGTVALARPVCRVFRFVVAKWTGTVVPAGYRQAPQVTQMSTGYWWNGYSYDDTSRDARRDQRRRVWLRRSGDLA